MRGQATLRISRARRAPDVVDAPPHLTPSIGEVVEIGDAAPEFVPGMPVALAGPALDGDALWHIDRAIALPEWNEILAARIILTAHFLFLLRRAGARAGERVVFAGGGGGGEWLRALADRYGLVRAAPAEAELLVVAGGELEGGDAALSPSARALVLAGHPPPGRPALWGPSPITDPRTVIPAGFLRWPLGRCLRTARTLALAPERDRPRRAASPDQ